MKNNIVLIGFMASGKSTIGKILSKIFMYRFIDTDELIETHLQMKIIKIFEIFGESYFRKVETEILNKIKKNKNSIIATGGGLPVLDHNKKILKSLGHIFYLEIGLKTFKKRTIYDINRPLKKREDLLKKRIAHYKRIADFTINCDYNSPEIIASKIKSIYENCCR